MGRCLNVFVVILGVLVAAWFAGTDPQISVSPTALEGRVVLITGGTSGIGNEAARLMSARGADVIITGRRLASAQAAAKDFGGTGLQLDLSDADSVRALATALETHLNERPLHALVLNAGMFPSDQFTGPFRTSQGLDMLSTANHLGHFYLVQLLRPRLASSRVVLVSSISSWWGTRAAAEPTDEWPSPEEGKPLDPLQSFGLYGATKFQNLLFGYKLHRELSPSGGSVVLVTPGFVLTSIGNVDRSKADVGKGLPGVMHHFARTALDGGKVLEAGVDVDGTEAKGKLLQPYWIWEGAASLLPKPLGTGVFYNIISEMLMQKLTYGPLRAHTTIDISYDEALQDKLWDVSLRLVEKM